MSATDDHLTIGVLVRLVDQLYARLDRELAELRVTLDNIDHETVKRGAFEELHTRVDAHARELTDLRSGR